MKVVAVNIGVRTPIVYNGKNEETGIYKYSSKAPIFLAKSGVKDDHVVDRRYHGGIDKACYAYGLGGYAFWKKQYPEKEMLPGMFGENLTIEGLDETNLFIGQLFKVGGALIQVSQPRIPCYKLGIRFNDMSMVKQFQMADFPGAYFRVLEEGFVKMGDELVLQDQKDIGNITVIQVFSLFRGGTLNVHLIEKALQEPFLSESIKTNIRGFLASRKKSPNHS